MSTNYYFDSGLNDTPVADPKIVEINDKTLVSLGGALGSGVEAKVYKIQPNKVIKLYHRELNYDNIKKYAI